MASDLRPALIGSVALHLSLLAAGLIVWPHMSRPMTSSPVAVTIVNQAPITDMRPAIEAPEPTPAAAPEPVAEAPPPEAVPTPTPTPPTPAPPAPAPPKPPALDLDALASRLPKPKPQPKLDLNALASKLPKPAAAPRGALRPELAVQSRAAAGAAQGLTADEASLLASKLNRLWNPNCGAEGAGNLVVRVNVRLTPTGDLASPPTLLAVQGGDPVWQAAAQRALTAVARGAPYDELPRDRYAVWKDINVNFNGRQACGAG